MQPHSSKMSFFQRSQRLALSVLAVITLTCLLPLTSAYAQSSAAGKTVYTSIIVTGQKSCSDAQCHLADPTRRQNKIQNGTLASVISAAIGRVTEMKFLQGKLTNGQLADLAAYIANPAGTVGTVGSPTASLSAASLAFGASTVGTAAATQSVTVSNAGTAALNLSGITTGSTEFTVSGGSCTATSSIAVGGNCSVVISFTPNAASARSATLTVSHNAVGGSASVSLSGTGTAVVAPAAALLSAASVSFPAVAVGSTSAGQTLTLNNSGGSPLTVSSSAVTGADFSISVSSCGASAVLAPGASCMVTVKFAPTVVGARSGTLTISHSAASATSSASLAGTGLPTVPVSATTKVMTEYRYTSLDYYFITSRDNEKVLLDGIAGFQRTGQSFTVYATQQPNTFGITRYLFDQVALAGSRSGHFYTLVDSEKAALRASIASC